MPTFPRCQTFCFGAADSREDQDRTKATCATNLGRDLSPSGEVCFPFIPFRNGTSLGTGTYATVGEGDALPNGVASCAATRRFSAAHRSSGAGTASNLAS